MVHLDSIEWVESLTLGPPTPTKEENRVESKQFHHWKGVGWNTHVIIQNKKHDHHSIGLFLGYSSTDKLPKDWNIHVRCQYTLLADDGKPLYECKEIRYHFKNEGAEHERVGSINVVDFEGLCDLMHHYSKTDSNFKIHTVIEELPPHSVHKRRSPSVSDMGVSDSEEPEAAHDSCGEEEASEVDDDGRNQRIERLSKILTSPKAHGRTKANAAKQLRRCLDSF